MRCIAAGDALIDPSVTRRLIRRFARAARPASLLPAQLSELTARELDVLRLIARGLANTEIAAELVVEESTVKTHVSRILMKLRLRDGCRPSSGSVNVGAAGREGRLTERTGKHMATELTGVIAEHIRAVNAFDTDAIVATFAADAYVNDNRREIAGISAIRRWVEKEMVGDKVTLDVREVVSHYGDTIVRAAYNQPSEY